MAVSNVSATTVFLAKMLNPTLQTVHTPQPAPAQPDFTVKNTGRTTSATQSFLTPLRINK